MKKFKLMLVAVMAMFGVNAFAALNLTSGAEQTINGITYKVLTCYKTETATNVNTVSAEQNNYTGTTLNIPATIKFSVEGTLDDTTVSAEYEDVEFKVVEIVKFQDLTNLTSATIGTDGVTYVKTIDPNAFKGCTSLKTVEFAQYTPYNDVAANATQTIGAGAFDGTAIETLDLTKTTITVLNKLFEDANGKLKAVKLPATLTEIAASAFEKCGVLSSVDFTLATKLKIIGNAAFATTPSLTTLDLSKCAALVYFTADGLVKGTNADVTPFTAGGTTTNDYLTTLTLPTTTKYIGTALKNCKVLATLNLDKTAIEGLVAGSLTGLDALTTLELPASCLTIAATGKTGLTSLKINGAGVATGTGLSLAPTAFTMDKDANSTITLGNIVKWVALTGAAIVIPAGDGSATVTVGDIAATANLSADFALVSGKVSSFTIGAIAATTTDFSAGFFGQAAKITFGGNITDGTKQIIPSATVNAALKEIDFGSIAIAAAAFQGAVSSTTVGVFDDTNAPALEKLTWTPATATAAFEQDVFSVAAGTRATAVKFSTTAAVAALYPVATNNLYDVEFAAPSVTLDPIKVANNGTGSWYYAAYHAAADVKIAAKQGDATVIVYAAYVNSTENTKVYHEQLRIVDGYYFIKGSAGTGVNVIVKSTSDADVVVKSATVTNANDGMPYQADATSHNKIEYVAGAKLGTEINAMAGANEVIYAVSKITKNNLAWKTVPATASASNWFIIRAPKTASEIAPARLLNVWSDGSEPDDDATAIKTVKSANAENGAIFNLAGQKVNAAYKGVVIKDGKKYIQK